jgi:hypothetical protein
MDCANPSLHGEPVGITIPGFKNRQRFPKGDAYHNYVPLGIPLKLAKS